MAENEPPAGQPENPEGMPPAEAASIEPASVEVTTVASAEPTPVAPIPPAAPTSDVALVEAVPVEPAKPPTKRPRNLARWGVALLALAAMVGVLSIAAVMLAAGGGSSTVQGWMPATTVAYVDLRADLPGDQRANVGDILAKFPGFADQSSMDAKIDEALDKVLEGSGVSWTTDIKPWLGGEVGVAATAAAFDAASSGAGSLARPSLATAPDDGAVALVAVKDPAAATAWVSRQIGGTQTTESYAGGDITLVSGLARSTRLAYAVRGTVLILGPEKTVKAALDTGGKSPVAASDSFVAATKTAPSNYLAFGYLDVKAVADASKALAGGASGVPAACVDQAVAMVPAWAAGSVEAQDSAIVFEASVAPVAGASAQKGTPSAVASHLPAATVAAIEVRDLGTKVVDGVAALKKALACDPAAAATLDQVDQALAAIGGIEAIAGWAGDSAIAVTFAGGTPGGGLAAMLTDEAAAKGALDQVKLLLALAGSGSGLTTRTEPYGSGELLVVKVPSQAVGADVPEIAVTLQGGILALGTIDFVKSVVDTKPDASLAKTDAYQRAMSLAGGDGVSDVFVGFTTLRQALEAMIPADQKAKYETEVKPFLEPFEAFASIAQSPGTSTLSRAVITLTK